MTDMEDRSRRNNVRLVGLPEGVEGSNATGFLRVNLSKWIPSLKGLDIEIDRAHRVYDGGRGSDQPRTLIFHVLKWHDRYWKVLGRLIRWNAHRTMSHYYFFPTLVQPQRSGGRHLIRFWKDENSAWSPALPHLSGGNQTTTQMGADEFRLSTQSGGFYQLPVSAEDICGGSAGGRRENGGRCLSGPAGGAWWLGWRRF